VSGTESEGTTAARTARAPELAVLDGALAGNRIAVDGVLIVGRGEGADVLIDDREMSRRHAAFRANGGSLEVEDLGSLNGTWVDGTRIESPTTLVSGSVVKLGQTRLEVVDAERVTAFEQVDTEPAADVARPSGAYVPGMSQVLQPHDDELRPVTALFADIVGSTAIGERLRPEEVREVVGECVSRMSRIVEQFGGVIDAYMGDGIAAFFGFPAAREDDVERAARSALRIIETIGEYAQEVRATWSLPDFNIRVGINSGQVAVGLVGAGDRRPVALGDTMNVAARLQSEAEPGTILVGTRTARELSGRFRLEGLGEVSVKGRDAPVEAWRLVSAEAPERKAHERPLVGRQAETQALHGAIESLAEGQGRALLLGGDHGIGKTRLLEFLNESAKGKATWLEGQCVSYGAERSPFVDILRTWLSVDPAEHAPVVRSNLERRLELLLGAQLPEVLPYLASFLSVQADPHSDAQIRDLSPDALAREIARAYSAWAHALSRSGPLVIAVDDFHWADEATVALANALLDVVAESPLVLAIALRREPETPCWRFRDAALADHGEHTTELRLGPLSEEESAQLLTDLAPDDLADEDRRKLLAAAEGNPLYLEQLLRFLRESGQVELRRTLAMTVVRHELPSALESILVARIDALPNEARRVLQTAAVTGRSFSLQLLVALIDAERLETTIQLLLRTDIIREVRSLPDREYEFTHGLLREAALSTLTRSRRRDIYRMVATAVERVHAASLDEHFEQLAFYNARAGDLPRSLWYLERAASRAGAIHAYTHAAELWRRASTLAEELGDVDAQRRISRALWQLSERDR
jgi:class 3 adenylate cyclase